MLLEKTSNLFASLVRHEPHGDLGVSLAWQDSLGTDTGVSTPNATHVQTRTYSGALERGVTLLATNFVYIQELLIFVDVERRPGKHGPILGA